jgi:GNAT superfamily N-acetyltransferase
MEESGLEGLRLRAYLGERVYDMRPVTGADHLVRRHFFHLEYPGPPSRESWRCWELDPSEGEEEAIEFELRWVRYPDEVPELAPQFPDLLHLVVSPVRIQEAGPDSFGAALSLLERFFSEEGFSTPAHEMGEPLRAMMADPGSNVFLAWRGDQAVGVATVTTSVAIEYGRSADLDDLYVLPAARGSGVGRALVEAVSAWSKDQGASILLVTASPEGQLEHGLLDYYRRRGFTNTGRLILERALHDRP